MFWRSMDYATTVHFSIRCNQEDILEIKDEDFRLRALESLLQTTLTGATPGAATLKLSYTFFDVPKLC